MTSQAQPANAAQPARISPSVIVARSPVTGEVLGQVTIATPQQIRGAVETARIAQPAWEGIGIARRLLFVRALLDQLYRQRDRILNTMVAEQGKVRYEALSEYLSLLELVSYYLRESKRTLATRRVNVRLLPHRRHLLERRPFGVALVIAPWNYPMILSLAPIMAALIAGNTVVFKPSEYATQVGEVIADLIREADFPPDVFHVLHGYGDVGAALIEAHPDRICFTGSVATGKKIAKAAADMLIPVTLELGGKDAAIVLDDADIDRAAVGIVWSGMFNAGQTCASVERVIVQRRVAPRLVQAMQRSIQQYIETYAASGKVLAAMTTPAQLEIVEAHVQDALAHGAQTVTGGYRLPEHPRYYAPTLLVNVKPEMRVAQEETFGPVIAVMVVETDDEAVELANDTVFGLTSSVWTRDRSRGLRVASRLKVGSVSINEHLMTSGISELPWGGVKESGYGRTRSHEGLLEMTYAKAVTMDRFRLPDLFWYPYDGFKSRLVERFIHLMYGSSLRDKLRALLP